MLYYVISINGLHVTRAVTDEGERVWGPGSFERAEQAKLALRNGQVPPANDRGGTKQLVME